MAPVEERCPFFTPREGFWGGKIGVTTNEHASLIKLIILPPEKRFRENDLVLSCPKRKRKVGEQDYGTSSKRRRHVVGEK